MKKRKDNPDSGDEESMKKKEDKLKQKTQRKTSDGEPGSEDAAGEDAPATATA